MNVIHVLILALQQICKNNYYFRKLFSLNLYKMFLILKIRLLINLLFKVYQKTYN
jgi:hypothetical protein